MPPGSIISTTGPATLVAGTRDARNVTDAHHLHVKSVMCHYKWSASRSAVLRRTCMKDNRMYGNK